MRDPVTLSNILEDLSPNTTYYYRAKAVSEAGEACGEGAAFTTLADEPLKDKPAPVQDELPIPSPGPIEPSAGSLDILPVDIPSQVPLKTSVQANPSEDSKIDSPSNRVSLKIPQGAIESRTEIEFSEKAPLESAGMVMLNYFDLNAYDSISRQEVTQFKKNLQISIQHDDEELSGLDSESLHLYYLDEETSQWLPLANSQYDKKTRTLTATTTHFTSFGGIR
jgi:hypothetical protein